MYFGAVTGSYVGGVTFIKFGYTTVFVSATILMLGNFHLEFIEIEMFYHLQLVFCMLWLL